MSAATSNLEPSDTAILLMTAGVFINVVCAIYYAAHYVVTYWPWG